MLSSVCSIDIKDLYGTILIFYCYLIFYRYPWRFQSCVRLDVSLIYHINVTKLNTLSKTPPCTSLKFCTSEEICSQLMNHRLTSQMNGSNQFNLMTADSIWQGDTVSTATLVKKSSISISRMFLRCITALKCCLMGTACEYLHFVCFFMLEIKQRLTKSCPKHPFTALSQ